MFLPVSGFVTKKTVETNNGLVDKKGESFLWKTAPSFSFDFLFHFCTIPFCGTQRKHQQHLPNTSEEKIWIYMPS